MTTAVMLGRLDTDMVKVPTYLPARRQPILGGRRGARASYVHGVSGSLRRPGVVPDRPRRDTRGGEVAHPRRVRTDEDKLLNQEISHRAPSLSQLPRNRRFGFTHLNFDQPLHPSTSYIIGDHDPNREAM